MAKKETKKPNFIVSFFLFLANSKKYNYYKEQTRDILHNQHNIYKKNIDYFFIFLIISSVAIFIYGVKHYVPEWLNFYAYYVTSAIFAIEYIINFWLYTSISKMMQKEYEEALFLNRKTHFFKVFLKGMNKKISYIFTPTAIIDLLAIVPAYRPLSILKIFVLFRFLKVLKHAKSMHQFIEVLADRKFELLTLFVILIFVVLVGGLAIYITEEHLNKNINTLFDAIYWSFITITTVGYGDISPVSPTGKFISFIIIIFGIAMISFATSVIVSAFSEKLTELKEDRVAEHISSSSRFLIICGYGQISKVFLSLIKDSKLKYIVLDKDREKVIEAINDGHDAICDNASRYEVIERFYNQQSKITLLALTGSDIENIYISLNAKSVSKDIEVISRASSKKLLSKYKRAGSDRIVLPNEIASSVMVASILHPTMYKAINAILHSKDVASLDELYITSDCKIVGKTIEEIDFTRHKLVLFGLQNGLDGEFKFNPKKDYQLKDRDILIIMGHKISINYFKSINGTGTYRWEI